jgi:phenylalanyl-tRNA synthetase beta chain
MQETISYPLVSRESLESVGQADDGRPPLRVANPMNAGQEYLRPTLRASLLQTLRYNQERLDLPFRFFEAGRVFLPREADLPEERDMAAGALCGPRSEASWLESAEYLGFFDAKGALTAALERISLAPDFQPASDPAFQPGRCASISAAGVDLGLVGELHPDIRERFDLRPHPVAMFEIDLARVLEAGQRGREGFKSLSRFPAATRDLALLVNADVPAGQVQAILGRHRLVEHVELFDVYTGDNIPAGAKSLALHVYFQSQQKTLTNEEVNRALEGLLRNLERETGATLRTG